MFSRVNIDALPAASTSAPAQALADVVMRIRRMVDAVLPAPRRPPLKLAELRDEPRMVEKLRLPLFKIGNRSR